MQPAFSFTLAENGIDPLKVPTRTLSSGAKIPAIGLGTFGSDHVSGEQVARAVVDAASVGFRHFDCASVYGNEHLVGQSLRAVMEGGVAREELWINSKLWNDKHAEEDVVPARQKSLGDLGLDYLDLYFVHWPFPNFHATGVDVSSRDPHARPYIHEEFMKTWRQMERLVDMGLVGHIEHDAAKTRTSAARRAHPARVQRDGAASAFSGERVLRVGVRARHRAHWLRPDWESGTT